MVAVNVKIIEELKGFLTLISSTSELKEICFERKEDFTRRRKLGFSETDFLMINMIKRSLKALINLNNYQFLQIFKLTVNEYGFE